MEILVLVKAEIPVQSAHEIASRRSIKGKEDIEKVLDLSWGCIGKEKTLTEIDAEIAAMRQEWIREWDSCKIHGK